jgi:tetratricopeptide (TPR) repeat protein/transglutaminase-like putative cysteine protease
MAGRDSRRGTMARMYTRVAALVLLTSSFIAAQSQPTVDLKGTSQEAFVFEKLKESVRFENDGSGVRETTAVIRIQSQAGVGAFGQLVFGYSTANEELRIDYVRVRTADGQVTETPDSGNQDFAPEVLREAPMYSDFRERHVSVVGIRPGVWLEYHVVTTVKPLAAGEFWYEYSFPDNYALLDGSLQVDVPKARELKVKSPDRKFETRDAADRRVYIWTVNNFVPDRKKKAEEEPDDNPDVQLSTFTDWQQVATWYAKLQSGRAAPDVSVKQKAAELTQSAKTQEEKAWRLYDFVARNIRYVSLSFGLGRLQPHTANEVLNNSYGDCKDKHTLLQAMLAAEGIQSYPVLIHSDRKFDPDVPSPAQFDHVITVARVGDKLTWLDATAEVAPYGLIAYQLRNKQAVVASNDSLGGLQRTPADSPVKNITKLNMKAKFSEFGALDADLELTASGDGGWPLRAVFRRVAEKDWPRTLEYLSHAMALRGDVSEVKIDALDDTTKPFHVVYHLHQSEYFKIPNSGINFQLLPSIAVGRVPKANKKHASEPLDVGPAEERVYRVRIEFPENFTPHIASDVSVTRDYGEYSSSYKLTKNVLEAERKMVLKVNELPAFRRADYESFHNVTTSAVEETPWCSISAPSSSAEATAAGLKGTPAELRDAGRSALKRQDFATAAALLQRAADQDPITKEGWEDLGAAYAGLSRHDKAVQAFTKQLEADPAHAHTNAELAGELQQLGRLDDAVAAYRKEIEIAPSEKFSHKQLGLLLVQLKRDPEARTELETAASFPPEDPEIKVALSQLYSRMGESGKSKTIMASLNGGVMSAEDFFGPVLNDDVDPNQAEHDAMKNLGDIGDQFEAGEYDHLNPADFSAMDLVALSWARLGWAYFLRGNTLQASQYLEAAWSLSLSGAVANRLGRVYEKTGARDHARHLYALAAAAGGPDAMASRDRVMKLGSLNLQKDLAQAAAELDKLRTMHLLTVSSGNASARFEMVFDNSTTPDRVRFIDGDESLRNAGEKLQKLEYPVRFPDISSIKIIRLGTVICRNSACNFELEGLGAMQHRTNSEVATAPGKNDPHK